MDVSICMQSSMVKHVQLWPCAQGSPPRLQHFSAFELVLDIFVVMKFTQDIIKV